MQESKKPDGVRLPKPVETHEHEDKRHKVAEYVYKKPEEADDGHSR